MNARIVSFLLASTGTLASLTAQTTWIVNSGGGPGVNFTDLPSAVQAAADGDTILVQEGPFGGGAVGFTTSKGLTIVGEGGNVSLGTSAAQPIEVTGLPVGSTFRMSGFSRSSNGKLHIRLTSCQGSVHFDQLRCRENLNGPEFDPSIVVDDCEQVTLRAVATYGNPALQVDDSRVLVSNCRLGRTYIGLGYGPCLSANDSVVDVVEPFFDTNDTAYFAAIESVQSDLRIVGSASSYVTNGNAGGVAILANGGTVTIDPRVQLSTSFPWGLGIVGTASLVTAEGAGSWFERGVAPLATNLEIRTVAPAGALVAPAIGAPGLLTATPLGVLGIDVLQPYVFLPVQTAPAAGVVTTTIAIPSTLPPGLAFAAQAAVVAPSGLAIGLPGTVVIF